MLQFFLIIIGLGILGFIFLRRYLMVEKNIKLSSLFFKQRHFFDKLHIESRFETKVDEMIPSPETTDPKNGARAAILLKKAMITLEKDDVKTAQKYLIQAIAVDPTLVLGYHQLGLIYLQQHHYGKAETIYRKLTLSVPEEALYMSNLGVALYHQKKLEEAKQYYKKAVALDSSKGGRFFSVGQICRELNQPQEAIEFLQKAVELEPQHIDYLLSLADVLTETGKTADAEQVFQKILALDPENPVALRVLRPKV